MKRTLIAITSGALAALGAFWLIGRGITGRPQAIPQSQAGAYAVSHTERTIHFPSSADKVKISAWASAADAASNRTIMRVQLHIQQGWHVNANPASLRFLIPTTLKAEAAGQPVALDFRYPPGRESNITLGGRKIRVYDDRTILSADLPQGIVQGLASGKRLTILATVQSCSDKGVCLPPARLTTELAAPSGRANSPQPLPKPKEIECKTGACFSLYAYPSASRLSMQAHLLPAHPLVFRRPLRQRSMDRNARQLM
ncbi:protein-disulfide reductase DsbD domain-containing protein [Acidiphilium sp.]|uniref:protein-disulfide reductase DsbD domain-containing protein n=1 Tax=Acidiphilium sp. TaxID=527 RepID=UPI002584F21A|nr:protein-disulfide reductase DsbD domain-containing protein [Acidiphilium sp.]